MPAGSLLGWTCPGCGAEAGPEEDPRACACGSPFAARYDLPRARAALGEPAAREAPGMWRWAPLLPVPDPRHRVSLGEGGTPLLSLPRLAQRLGVPSLLVKDEGRNPTGSFKARGLAAALSAARRAGTGAVALATAGNAGGACAAYAAAGGIEAHVFAPGETSPVVLDEIRSLGADLHLVEGDISRAYDALASALASGPPWRDVSVSREPHRIEAKKTMAFELLEQSGPLPPSWIVLPTGGGVAAVAHLAAFRQLAGMGLLSGPFPRLVAVQAQGCAPIVRAWEEGRARPRACPDPAPSLAEGIRVPRSVLGTRVLDALRETDGRAVVVDEAEILRAIRRAAADDGFLLCPEGAAALAGVVRLAREEIFRADDRVVFYNTASPYKYPAALAAAAGA